MNKKVIKVFMRLKKIAFFSVVFPSIKQYLDDFFCSLSEQTVKEFDLFLVNDGLEDLEKFKIKYGTLNIKEIVSIGTPSKLRESGINLVSGEGYEIIIFGDADDYFAKNRVEKSVELLKDSDIVVNDFDLVDENRKLLKEHYLSKRVNPEAIVSPEFIKDKNIFGFSNTAVRRQILSKVTFSARLIAVDWYFFSCLLNAGAKAIFTGETITNYRQHRLNTVGIGISDYDNFLKSVRVKLLQYEEMSKIIPLYARLKEDTEIILRRVESDDNFREYYLSKIKINAVDNPLWWEYIKIGEDLK